MLEPKHAYHPCHSLIKSRSPPMNVNKMIFRNSPFFKMVKSFISWQVFVSVIRKMVTLLCKLLTVMTQKIKLLLLRFKMIQVLYSEAKTTLITAWHWILQALIWLSKYVMDQTTRNGISLMLINGLLFHTNGKKLDVWKESRSRALSLSPLPMVERLLFLRISLILHILQLMNNQLISITLPQLPMKLIDT